jgi:nitroimidazol reductase NimA-like FMN-containing flavoprotein (pyridoxamine 5'-phosphate oxidase superfamily)
VSEQSSERSERTKVTRLREKVRTERAALDALLDSTIVGHFALTLDDGSPVVLPTAVARDGDRVLAHGSTGSRWMRRLADGAPTCLAITALDGLVVARSAFESSLHYRSAVLFGSCTVLPAAQKEAALDLLTEALLPGRAAEVRRPSRRELEATLVLALPITEWSLKVSDGWPDDPPEDVAGPAWAGVVPLQVRRATPVPAPDLRPGIPLPPSVAGDDRARRQEVADPAP